MRRHVKENKAGMNSGTWNRAQKNISSNTVQEVGGWWFTRRMSVMTLGDPLWAHDQETGSTLLYLIGKISVMGTEDECVKHTP